MIARTMFLSVLLLAGCATADPDECQRIYVPGNATEGGGLAGSERSAAGSATGTFGSAETNQFVEVNCQKRLYKPGEERGEPKPEPKPL